MLSILIGIGSGESKAALWKSESLKEEMKMKVKQISAIVMKIIGSENFFG